MNTTFSRLKFMTEMSKILSLQNGYLVISRQTFRNSTHNLSRKSVVPQHPVTTSLREEDLPPKTVVDLRLVQLLEKLSLVDFANKEGIAVLEAAIRMADRLSVVNTEGVEPMITVLEDRSLTLADDVIDGEDLSEEVVNCAHTTEDDNFVVPPGNITYTQEKTYHTQLKPPQDNSSHSPL